MRACAWFSTAGTSTLPIWILPMVRDKSISFGRLWVAINKSKGFGGLWVAIDLSIYPLGIGSDNLAVHGSSTRSSVGSSGRAKNRGG